MLTGLSVWAEEGTELVTDTAVSVSSDTVEVIPFARPVSAKIGGKTTKVVSGFGKRKVPGSDQVEPHDGIDFVVPPEANVKAAQDGKVLFAGYSSAYVSRADKKDKNHLVIIQHADGKSTRYVHLERLRVRPGAQVKTGDVIGTTSNSDEWTVPVLHFEIREANGKALNPIHFLMEPQKELTK